MVLQLAGGKSEQSQTHSPAVTERSHGSDELPAAPRTERSLRGPAATGGLPVTHGHSARLRTPPFP